MWFKRDLTSIRWIFMSLLHYSDVIMSAMASQITSLTIVYSTAYSGADQRKHQSSASLAFVRGIHRWPVNSPHKGPVMREMFSFDDVIMEKDDALLEKMRCMSVSSDCASTVYQWPRQPYHPWVSHPPSKHIQGENLTDSYLIQINASNKSGDSSDPTYPFQ